eukprot:PhM_4_TR6729/c0_g1_i1/m.102911
MAPKPAPRTPRTPSTSTPTPVSSSSTNNNITSATTQQQQQQQQHRTAPPAVLSALERTVNAAYTLESVEHCYLTIELTLMLVAAAHMFVQQYNIAKWNVYLWDSYALTIGCVSLLRRMLIKVVQSARVHQDAQEELIARRLLDSQQTGNSGGGDFDLQSALGVPASPSPSTGKRGGKHTAHGGHNSSPGALNAATAAAALVAADGGAWDHLGNSTAGRQQIAIPQVRALNMRRAMLETRSRRQMFWLGVMLLVSHVTWLMSYFGMVAKRDLATMAITGAPGVVYLCMLCVAENWAEKDAVGCAPATRHALAVTVRRQLLCSFYTAVSLTFHTTVTPLLLTSDRQYFSLRRCQYTCVSLFLNILLVLLVQGFYKGVPLFATARMHDLLVRAGYGRSSSSTHASTATTTSVCAVHAPTVTPTTTSTPDVLSSSTLRLVEAYSTHPDAVHRTVAVAYCVLIAAQSYVCFLSSAWHVHTIMLLCTYLGLHHCQQCRHDLISSPFMNALLNHGTSATPSSSSSTAATATTHVTNNNTK